MSGPQTHCPKCGYFLLSKEAAREWRRRGMGVDSSTCGCGSGKPIIDFDEGDILPEPRLMVLRDTSHAFHKLGDIGRPESNCTEFIWVRSVKPDFLVGSFVEGYGFFNVHFPQTACIAPTASEKERFDDMRFEIRGSG